MYAHIHASMVAYKHTHKYSYIFFLNGGIDVILELTWQENTANILHAEH